MARRCFGGAGRPARATANVPELGCLSEAAPVLVARESVRGTSDDELIRFASTRAKAIQRTGHAEGKKTSAPRTMITGNMPMGNNVPVTPWNISTAQYAIGRR